MKQKISLICCLLVGISLSACSNKGSDDLERLVKDEEVENLEVIDYADIEEDTAASINENRELTFEDLSKVIFEHASGVGGWSEELYIETDGSMHGNFHDSEMGDVGEEYPDGTLYLCSYSGKFTNLTKIDDYTYEVTLAEINYDEPDQYIEIVDGVRNYYVTNVALSNNDTFKIYLPGKLVKDMNEEVWWWLQWSNDSEDNPGMIDPDVLTKLALADEENEIAFYTYARPTPHSEAVDYYNGAQINYDFCVGQIERTTSISEMETLALEAYESADRSLGMIWDNVKATNDEARFKEILEEQRAWIAEKEAAGEEAQNTKNELALVESRMLMAKMTLERCEALIEYIPEEID